MNSFPILVLKSICWFPGAWDFRTRKFKWAAEAGSGEAEKTLAVSHSHGDASFTGVWTTLLSFTVFLFFFLSLMIKIGWLDVSVGEGTLLPRLAI